MIEGGHLASFSWINQLEQCMCGTDQSPDKMTTQLQYFTFNISDYHKLKDQFDKL